MAEEQKAPTIRRQSRSSTQPAAARGPYILGACVALPKRTTPLPGTALARHPTKLPSPVLSLFLGPFLSLFPLLRPAAPSAQPWGRGCSNTRRHDVKSTCAILRRLYLTKERHVHNHVTTTGTHVSWRKALILLSRHIAPRSCSSALQILKYLRPSRRPP